MNTIQSQGGAVAVGGNVYDQRSFHLPAAPPTGPAFVVPYPRNPLFTGRDAELARLGAGLDGGAGVAVVGTGGLGKTQLAAEYAHAARAQYPGGVFWLNMEQAEGIAGQVADLAGPRGLNLPAAPALDFQGKRDAVRAAWEEPVARLLIFDNLEDPAVWREWRPKGGGARVLITSRYQSWTATSGVEPLPLQPLVRPASQELLLAPRARVKKTTAAALLTDRTTATDADAICEALGDLPLALALAGAYLETTPSATLARYRADIEAAPLARLETTLDEPLPTGHEASILKTFALSYDKLDANKPDDALARTLLHRAALLAPAPIPRRLLARAAGLDPDDAYAQEQADHALRRLAALGLIEDLGDEGVRLHRLLAAYIRTRITDSGTDNKFVEEVLLKQMRAIKDAGYPLAAEPYLPHLHHIADIARSRRDASAGTILNNVGYLVQDLGDWVTARNLFQESLKIYIQTRGPTHPDTGRSLNNLALLSQAQGDLAAARPLLERVLAIDKAVYGQTHHEVALDLNNLASLLQDQGELTKAHTLYEQALAIYVRTRGALHPDTARTLNNLGRLIHVQGDSDTARMIMEASLLIYEQALGVFHPDIVPSLNNLGLILQAQHNLAVAQQLYERAAAICEQSLGEMHPLTVESLNNLALVLEAQEDLAGARVLFDRSLGICLKIFGSSHPVTAHVLHNLAGLLHRQGDLVTARPLLEQAILITERMLGPNHHYTAGSLNNLAGLLKDQGDLAAALPLYERALTISKTTLGQNHSQTAVIQSNLAALLEEIKNSSDESTTEA